MKSPATYNGYVVARAPHFFYSKKQFCEIYKSDKIFNVRKDTLILIPSYEPDETLYDTVKSLYDADFNILVVNDGSSSEYDKTFDRVKPFVQYLKQDKNRGKGAALKLGFKNALTLFPNIKYIITADGDGQHSTKDIIRIHEKLEEKNELVFGVRHFDRDVPFRSRFGNDWSKLSRSMATKQYVPDDQCGLRGFPVRYINELIKIKGNRYEYEMNEIVQFELQQYKIYLVIIETIYLNNNSRSHFSPFIDTCRIQGIIHFHALPSIICFGLLLAGLLVAYNYNFVWYHTVVLLGYTGIAIIYWAIISLIHPSRRAGRRLINELLFASPKMAFVFAMMWLFNSLIHVPYQVVIPISMVLAAGLNILLSWAFRKFVK